MHTTKDLTTKIIVPPHIAKSFTDNARFILDNTHTVSGNPIWKFCWHPFTGELLFDVEPVPHKQIAQLGAYNLPEYLRGIYMKVDRLVMFRPYFNPCISQEFDKELSTAAQNACKVALGGEGSVNYGFDVDNQYLIQRYGNRGW